VSGQAPVTGLNKFTRVGSKPHSFRNLVFPKLCLFYSCSLRWSENPERLERIRNTEVELKRNWEKIYGIYLASNASDDDEGQCLGGSYFDSNNVAQKQTLGAKCTFRNKICEVE